MITTSKDASDKSDAEILKYSLRYVLKCDLAKSKRSLARFLDSAFALWGNADVAAVHSLDEK